MGDLASFISKSAMAFRWLLWKDYLIQVNQRLPWMPMDHWADKLFVKSWYFYFSNKSPQLISISSFEFLIAHVLIKINPPYEISMLYFKLLKTEKGEDKILLSKVTQIWYAYYSDIHLCVLAAECVWCSG